ncbi:MAG: VOC family protein [Acidimicrobiia bacterium]|nr:VOC family protein [Acidimicrobiia bacterium]
MATIDVTGFDHLVLRCGNVEASLAWYVEVLGLAPVRVEAWRAGEVPFPSVRVTPEVIIDLIPRHADDAAAAAAAAAAERNVDHICLVASAETIATVDAERDSFRVVDGPGTRFGAQGDGWSIYVLDPDDYAVELRTYDQ